MNRLVRHSITQAIEAIRADRCDQFVVKSLLIDLREQSPSGSILREIGHFIAHPEARDRGLNHENIGRMASEMKVAFEQGGSFTVAPTFDGAQIILDLSNVLVEAGFGVQAKDVIQAKGDEVILCILALLQGARFDGLPVNADAFLVAENGKLTLACKFASTGLGVPAFGRPNVDFALPLIVTAVDAPDGILHPGRTDGRATPLFEVVRESGNRLGLRQVF